MQLAENIRQLHELSTRIDERLKHMVEKHSAMSDKMDQLMTRQGEFATRLAVIEASNLSDLKEMLDEVDKRLVVAERLLHNKVNDDVEALKTKLHALEIANEHNTSYRTKGEDRLQWWLDISMKFVLAIAGAAVVWKLGIKN